MDPNRVASGGSGGGGMTISSLGFSMTERDGEEGKQW